jgi:Arc/MetJ-type ribon-helix-helix transcriptional regulator
MDLGGCVMPTGTPRRVTEAFERSDFVRVTLVLDRRVLEDLELLLEHRHGARSRSEVVREAIRWLRAREAASIVQLRGIQERKADAAAREAEAIAHSRAERDVRDQEHELVHALAIAVNESPDGVG